ncbi:hypothetical protein FHP29_05240 [Nocardioides albidus]|uniref:Polysaccharide biosynthesis protein n=1 Tax=Nocardioides albidus TaxID=1517589 RepID=A0A5C4W792_9ACTN|nr:oligosaccharide flippase family protein [Nocardioides albidus]TNM44117.1 hypothetical protein FHP29_05240 [Nocardioides albidus]
MSDRTTAPGRGLTTVALIAVATLGVQAMTLLTGVVSARLLGVEGRGQLALIAAVSGLFARLTMGGSLPVTVSQLLARERLTARDGLRPFVPRWSLVALLPAVAAGTYAGWLLRDETPLLTTGLAAATAAMTYQGIASSLLGSALQGELASIRTVSLGAIMLAVPFPVALVLAVVTVGVDDALTIAAILVAAGVVGLVLNVRLLKPATGTPSTLDAREIRRTSRANFVAAVGTINGLGLDRNLVGAWLGTVALGFYAVGAAFATLSTIIGSGVASLLLPRLAATADDPAEQRRRIRTWLTTTAILLALLVGLLEAIVDPLIRLAFGEEFAPAIEIARWLILADGLLGFRRLPICVLQARGRGGVASSIEFAVTVVVVAGIAVAAVLGELVLVAVVMAVGGVLSLLLLGLTVCLCGPRALPRHRR